MYTAALSTLTACLTLCFSTAWGQTNACDLTGDKVVNTADVQAAINISLGISPCTANIVGANVCNAEVVQRVINAYLGGGCLTSVGLQCRIPDLDGKHLAWRSWLPGLPWNQLRRTIQGARLGGAGDSLYGHHCAVRDYLLLRAQGGGREQ